MKNKRFIGTFLTAIFASLIAVILYATVFQPKEKLIPVPSEQKMLYTNFSADSNAGIIDFTYAAEKAVHSVVHVKTKSTTRDDYASNPLYEFFFGDRGNMQPRPVMGFGSGVIISDDGYIITNNHVIDKMDEVEIVLNDRRSFSGELVAADPNTDIALLKIKAENLPYLKYGNSDDLKLGQWVLAVGNPYNLTSTVTAGIVSAKARGDLGILRERSQFPIESFIQTDAAVNPGNSGGALVNTAGELVGINTAIASQTGAYSGNSFAVPVSIVKKVISDLMEFGVVQRAILGVTIQDVTQELANEHNIKNVGGVYINGLRDDGAAKEAGIKEGDIILSVNNIPVNSVSQLQEQISLYRPNDKVNLSIERSGKEKQFTVTLRNLQGNTEAVKKDVAVSILGATFSQITNEEKKELNISNGVKIVTLTTGKLMKAGIKEGFIIVRINNKAVSSIDDVNNIISVTRGGVYIEGIYPDGQIAYYAFGL